jgi:hypothetical protein
MLRPWTLNSDLEKQYAAFFHYSDEVYLVDQFWSLHTVSNLPTRYKYLVMLRPWPLTSENNMLFYSIMVIKCTKLYDPVWFLSCLQGFNILSNAETFIFDLWPSQTRDYFIYHSDQVTIMFIVWSLSCLHGFSTKWR